MTDISAATDSAAADLAGDIGRRLAAYRGERGLRVAELAREIGVTPSLISQIERGQSRPSVSTLFALAQALDVPVDAFFREPAAASPPDLVMRPQYTEIQGQPGIQPAPFAFAFAYHHDGKPVSGWPVKMPGVVEDYGSAQEFVTEGDTAPVAADVTGTGAGPDEVAVGPVFSPPYLISPTGQIIGTYGAAASWPPIRHSTGTPTTTLKMCGS